MTTHSSSPDRANAHRTTRSLGVLSLSILLLVLVIPALVWGEEKGFSATSATNESEGSVNTQIELMALDQKKLAEPAISLQMDRHGAGLQSSLGHVRATRVDDG